MNRGWVKYWRKQWGHWVSTDQPYCKGYAWVYLYSHANHKHKEVLINGGVITLKRGEHLTSIVKLAEIWGWSRKKVSNFLKHLEKSGMIEQERTTKYTLIRISNYAKYQSNEATENSKQASREHQRNTNKNEEKMYKNPLTTA